MNMVILLVFAPHTLIALRYLRLSSCINPSTPQDAHSAHPCCHSISFLSTTNSLISSICGGGIGGSAGELLSVTVGVGLVILLLLPVAVLLSVGVVVLIYRLGVGGRVGGDGGGKGGI